MPDHCMHLADHNLFTRAVESQRISMSLPLHDGHESHSKLSGLPRRS